MAIVSKPSRTSVRRRPPQVGQAPRDERRCLHGSNMEAARGHFGSFSAQMTAAAYGRLAVESRCGATANVTGTSGSRGTGTLADSPRTHSRP
jgi:hypothetical protein